MKYIYVICFFTLLAMPFLLLSIGFNPPKVNIVEKRKLAAKPNFHETSISKLPKQYENYLTDNLPFRTQIIAKYISIWETLLSSFVRKNIKGIDNHYFPNMKSAPTVSRYLGLQKLPLKNLYLFRTVVAGRQAFWQSHNATYLFMLLPDKTTLYPEFLPEWIQDKYSWYDQLNRSLVNTNINYLGVNDVLVTQKNPKTPFFNLVFDVVHWNGNALDVMYKVISNKFKNNIHYQQVKDITTAYTVQPKKILASLFDGETVPWIKLEKKGLRLKNHNYKGSNQHPWFSCDIIINDKLKSGTLLFATDSYFKKSHQDIFEGAHGAIFPFAHNVHKMINVHYTEKFSIISDIAQTEKPNIVIEASAERAGYNIARTAFPRLLIAGEMLLGDSQLIIDSNLINRTSKHLNCNLKISGNKLQVVAINNDPIVYLPTHNTNKDGRVAVMAKVHSPVDTIAMLFYAQVDDRFSGKRMVSKKIKSGLNYLHFQVFTQPNKKIRLRFDPGTKKATYTIFPIPNNKEIFEEKL